MGVLARGERHGYRLRDDLAADLGPRWRIDFGQLYRALRSMQRHGWVRVRRQPGASGADEGQHGDIVRLSIS